MEQRVDGIHLGEDEYKQGVVPPGLDPFSFTGWTTGFHSDTDLAHRV